jgi:hypothetical protein
MADSPHQIVRSVANVKLRPMLWRSMRPFIVAHSAEFEPSADGDASVGTLIVTGFLRSQGLKKGQLLQIAEVGTFPCGDTMTTAQLADENVLEGEQTWPTKAELAGDYEGDAMEDGDGDSDGDDEDGDGEEEDGDGDGDDEDGDDARGGGAVEGKDDGDGSEFLSAVWCVCVLGCIAVWRVFCQVPTCLTLRRRSRQRIPWKPGESKKKRTKSAPCCCGCLSCAR